MGVGTSVPGAEVIQQPLGSTERKSKLGWGSCRPVQPVASESKEIICSLAKAVHGLAPSPWLEQNKTVVPTLAWEPGTKDSC